VTILEEAQKLVYGDRNAAYGHPHDDYTRTAKIWSAILGIDVTPLQACLCMIGVKISREVHGHRRDTLVDIAGYADCCQRIAERMESERIAAETPKRTTDRK
jgi:hypothetical protein